MTISSPLPPPTGHNQQTFDTCIALALQLVASLELGPTLGDDPPAPELLLEFALELDRHAHDIARLAGTSHANIPALALSHYQGLRSGSSPALSVASHALHTAAYLALPGGQTTAVMLGVISCALRDLALSARTRIYH